MNSQGKQWDRFSGSSFSEAAPRRQGDGGNGGSAPRRAQSWAARSSRSGGRAEPSTPSSNETVPTGSIHAAPGAVGWAGKGPDLEFSTPSPREWFRARLIREGATRSRPRKRPPPFLTPASPNPLPSHLRLPWPLRREARWRSARLQRGRRALLPPPRGQPAATRRRVASMARAAPSAARKPRGRSRATRRSTGQLGQAPPATKPTSVI